jgi:hypothetical protein
MEQDGNAHNVVVRFPDESRDFRFPEDPLEEGDVIWHEGERYRVLHVASQDGAGPVVTVEVESDALGDKLRSEEGAIRLTLVAASDRTPGRPPQTQKPR